MDKLKIFTVVIDGIDKAGKDTLAGYVWRMDKRLNVFVRGWPSLVVYANKFNRNVEYALPYKDALYVHLRVSPDDWKIRCEMTNEPAIDYKKDDDAFYEAFQTLINNGYHTRRYNTSLNSMYEIANDIICQLRLLNE